MHVERAEIGEEKVRFLATVIASISHELKNALATVHETAGLLSDILRASSDPAGEAEEIRRCADDISDEMDRAYAVIRNLNVFAHSADVPVKELDPGDVAELMSVITSYTSYAGRARLAPGEPVRVVTSPLLLEDLLYRVLQAGYREAGKDAELALSVHDRGGEAEIRLTGLAGGKGGGVPPAEVRPILDALAGDLVIDEQGRRLRIRLPAAAGKPSGQ
jgi:K+-sensing histidine kinase KdpD